MKLFRYFVVLWFVFQLPSLAFSELDGFSKLSEKDWPWWRGPLRNGKAMMGETPPVKWSENQQVKWKAKVPGRGHASPIVVSNSVILATADESSQTQSVLSFSRKTGEKLWETVVYRGGLSDKIHSKNTHASQTMASDGERVYVSFDNQGKIFASALDMKSGKLIWSKEVGVFSPQRYKFGYGSSPLIYGTTFIVASESDSSSQIVAFDLETGKEEWRTPRALNLNWASPTIAHLKGKDQLLLSGNKKITSYDPMTGQKLWDSDASATATCGTCVWDGELIFASGGYPEKETAAVKVGGGLVWKNRTNIYEPSMLAHDGYLYAISDSGKGYCWEATTGRLMWEERLLRALSASPILVGDKIYLAGGKGETIVFEANPKSYVELARNKLGDDNFTTPAFCHNEIYIRVGQGKSSNRQEWLYCIGN
jgi:outer membrane protein assembly factor BamB